MSEAPNETELRERAASVTSDPTTEFFDELGRRGHEPLLAEGHGQRPVRPRRRQANGTLAA